MKLNLTAGGKIVATTTVAPFVANNDYYLKAFCRQLILRHHKKLRAINDEPLFSVESTADAEKK